MRKLFIAIIIFSVTATVSLLAQTETNPFAKYGLKKVMMATSSKGEFKEFHYNKEVVEIGSVFYNTKTNKVVGYVDEDTDNNIASSIPAMSIDPLCEKYYWISPYAYCLNNPVKFVDPDGEKPTTYEAALMAQHVYSGTGELAGGWTISTKNFGNGVVFSDAGSGFSSAVYERTVNGTTEYSYVTAGTNPESIADWKNNVNQVLTGESTQYTQSMNNSINIAEQLGGAELTFTGHSLGGGLAAVNAMATKKEAITFNAAGVSAKTIEKNNLFTGVNIDAYVVKGEILDHIQTQLGLKANGTIHTLPAVYAPQLPLTTADDIYRTYQRVNNHSIGIVVEKLKSQ